MFFGRWEPDFKKIVECTWLEQTVITTYFALENVNLMKTLQSFIMVLCFIMSGKKLWIDPK